MAVVSNATRQIGDEWLLAQHSVLGSVLLEPELVPRLVAETASADYSGPCRTVFGAIRKLFLEGASVDIVSVAAALGGEYNQYLSELMSVTPTAAHFDSYLRICREQSRTSQLRDVAHQILAEPDPNKLRQLMEAASGLMVDRPTVKITTMQDALRSFMERHTRDTCYLTWPIKELNDRLFAELGDLIILGGYPSTGKSALALQYAWHWAKQYKVGFFSLETSSEKLFDRQMSATLKLRMSDVKNNRIDQAGWDRVGMHTQEILAKNLELIQAAGFSVADVRAITMQRGYQIIFVDYLQLLQGSGENRTAQVTSISIALHTMAQSLGVTVVALSQMARQGQQGGRPDMSALRESGQIEQDADIVMILSLHDKENRAGPRVLDIAKNKEGTCPNILLAFDGEHQTFSKASENLLGKLVKDGKKVKRNAYKNVPTPGQMTMLPNNTPVPFQD